MVEGCRGPNNLFLKCPSASSHGGAVIMQRISANDHWGSKRPSVVPLKSFIPKGPLSTSVWNHTSIWRPLLISFRSALQRAIYPVWNAETILLSSALTQLNTQLIKVFRLSRNFQASKLEQVGIKICRTLALQEQDWTSPS